ncbi:hypothetical protein [Streptomyces sp. NPDC051684]|uniref:hypothetical protein n=1 Tax=Streptomyces sp. NPDC051684 TaxID=3365670 RepID=UPI0037B5BC58
MTIPSPQPSQPPQSSQSSQSSQLPQVAQTAQFDSFLTNLTYARRMVDAGKILEALSPRGVDTEDFYRAAWVQAIGALEHWVQEETLRRVTEEAVKASPDMPRRLREYPLPLHRMEAVQRGEVRLADAVVERIREDVAYRALQNPDAIAKMMALATDAKVWREAAKWVNRRFRHRTSFDEKSLRGKYVTLLRRRNQIAHEADLLDGDHTRRRPLTAAEAGDAIDWIEHIALALARALHGEPAGSTRAAGVPAQGGEAAAPQPPAQAGT